eukprot:Opistho-2@64159
MMSIRFRACMLLGAVGDAMGYKNGSWEFTKDGRNIHADAEQLGGVLNLHINKKEYRVSDDTVMSLASAEALLMPSNSDEELYENFVERYIECMGDMTGRAPGNTTIRSIRIVANAPTGQKWRARDFDISSGGCGAAMRALPIGLRFWRPNDMRALVACAIESGRITHHSPTGYLGSVAGAAFVAYAIQGVPINKWGQLLLDEVIPLAREHIEQAGRFVLENLDNFSYFVRAWDEYLRLRGIRSGDAQPVFPAVYGVLERDQFYESVSHSVWGGSSGHDAPLIAYDALLGSNGSWEELLKRGVLHGGDNDSTGILCCGWYGAIFGFTGVPLCNYDECEYKERSLDLADKLCDRFGN